MWLDALLTEFTVFSQVDRPLASTQGPSRCFSRCLCHPLPHVHPPRAQGASGSHPLKAAWGRPLHCQLLGLLASPGLQTAQAGRAQVSTELPREKGGVSTPLRAAQTAAMSLHPALQSLLLNVLALR